MASTVFLSETWFEMQKMCVWAGGGRNKKSEDASASVYGISWKKGVLGASANPWDG